MATYIEIAREVLREIRQARDLEGLTPRIDAGTRVVTPMGVGVLMEPAFPGLARVALPENNRHLEAIVDLPWEDIKPIVN